MSTDFTDQHGNLHHLSKLLGRGGQGAVYRTMDPDLVIKIRISGSSEPEEDLKEDLQKLRKPNEASRGEELPAEAEAYAELRRLPIPGGSHIAMPLALLRNVPGYVMHLMAELSPASSLWPDATYNPQEVPEWLSLVEKESPQAARLLLRYRDTGSLRQRLSLCARCAAEMARLHARSLVYCDLSPNNVFYSEDRQYPDVWLIDADNLHVEGEGESRIIYTPGYGAPELVRQQSACNARTDCYALAVFSFLEITLTHPFLGRMAYEEEDDWSNEESGDGSVSGEEKAYRGLLPWIDDPDDDSNALETFALTRALVLTSELVELFRRTFCEGREHPASRPLIWHWPEAFVRAADQTVACPGCGMTYYATQEEKCPYCEAPLPERVSITSYRWRGKGEQAVPVWRFEREVISGVALRLPCRIFRPVAMADLGADCAMKLLAKDGHYQLSRCDAGGIQFLWAHESLSSGRFEPMPDNVQVPADFASFWILSKGDSTYLIKVTLPPFPRKSV